ncbi:hypothetical protein BC628DRAFT_976991 [Trametes gibbosa]|nr:hypothetical protein BC628DRAFT_976991 [Trametes gibbosa]
MPRLFNLHTLARRQQGGIPVSSAPYPSSSAAHHTSTSAASLLSDPFPAHPFHLSEPLPVIPAHPAPIPNAPIPNTPPPANTHIQRPVASPPLAICGPRACGVCVVCVRSPTDRSRVRAVPCARAITGPLGVPLNTHTPPKVSSCCYCTAALSRASSVDPIRLSSSRVCACAACSSREDAGRVAAVHADSTAPSNQSSSRSLGLSCFAR